MLHRLAGDLRNEYTHMLFYLLSSTLVRGIHRRELSAWLAAEAASEMNHVGEFSRLIVSLGGCPAVHHHDVPALHGSECIIKHAIKMEQEVCANYARRIDQIDAFKATLGDEFVQCDGWDLADEYAAWTRVGQFYESQLDHSHRDLDEMRQMLR